VSLVDVGQLREIAEVEFADITEQSTAMTTRRIGAGNL